MKDKFQETYDQIKAPEGLKNRVLIQMEEQEREGKHTLNSSPTPSFRLSWKYQGVAAAVLLCFIFFHFWSDHSIYKTPLKDGEYLHVVELQDGYLQFLENGSLISLIPNAGVTGKEEPKTEQPDKEVFPIKEGGTVTVEMMEGKHIKSIPEQLRSYMGQQELVLTVLEDSGQKIFEAEFEKGGVLYRITGENVSQKQFIDFLAERINNGT